MHRRFELLIFTCVMTVVLGLASTAVADRPQSKSEAENRSSTKKKEQAKKPRGAFAPVKDDPALPRVLLIGDSISIGYTQDVQKLLAGKANVHRIPTNGGPTIRGLAGLDNWLGDGDWDVIHFNWGLHDLRQDTPGKHQVPIDKYEENLEKLVQRLKKTGATLIWASTTPVPDKARRRMAGDELEYNEIAEKIAKNHGIAINDLHGFAQGQLEKIQKPADVHFTPAGSKVLATQVAEVIEAKLPKQ